ncbi:MAG TPA: hypothetical protein PK020_22460 [Ilumatobacteraceae bacterium]|nr:hypothetical protein [Ilumatobacteraceae bacterium]
MDVSELISTYPRVFHSASGLAWPSIKQHGLLSTQRLLDLYQVSPHRQVELLTQRRSESVELVAPGLPPAVIRDQKPMKFLGEKIEPGGSVESFLMAINSRVFFWPSLERLERLRQAKEYRNLEQVILHVDTKMLVERYEDQIELCRFNSGAITQRNHPLRSRDSWVAIDHYPHSEYRRKHGRVGALAEVTVLDAVPDVLDMVADIEHVRPSLARANAAQVEPGPSASWRRLSTRPICGVPGCTTRCSHWWDPVFRTQRTAPRAQRRLAPATLSTALVAGPGSRRNPIQPASVSRLNISPSVDPLSWTWALSATSATSQASVAATSGGHPISVATTPCSECSRWSSTVTMALSRLQPTSNRSSSPSTVTLTGVVHGVDPSSAKPVRETHWP